MSAILLNLNSQAADTAESGFTDIVGLAGSASVGAASSVVLLICTMPQRMDIDGNDHTYDIRFEIDSVLVGPELHYFVDDFDGNGEGCGGSICFATTLSAASHDFAVQWRNHGTVPQANTGRERTFQVIEITDATILVDVSSTASDDATTTLADIVGLSDTKTVTTGAIHLILANMPIDDSGGDATVYTQLAIDDVAIGPQQMSFVDSTNDVCGMSFLWPVTGLTGSTKFALQWDETQPAIVADTGRVRTLQVIEITANVGLPFTPVTSTASQSLTAGYDDITDMTSGAFTIDSADSILLFCGHICQQDNSDNMAFYRFYDGATGEGPEMHIYSDSATDEEGCGHSIFWAATGKTGSHTFTIRGDEQSGSVTMHTTRPRGFGILELTAAAAAGFVGSAYHQQYLGSVVRG